MLYFELYYKTVDSLLAGNQERLGCKKMKIRAEASMKHRESTLKRREARLKYTEAKLKRQEASVKCEEASMKRREDSVKCREASMKHTEARTKCFITDYLSDFDSFLRKMMVF